MQNESKILIKVKSPKVWEKFKDFHYKDFNLVGIVSECELVQLASTNKTTCTILCSYDETELWGCVKELSIFLGKDGIIISNNVNLTGYSGCCYFIYYLGDNIREEDCEIEDEDEYDEDEDIFDKMKEWNIVDFLNLLKCSVNKKEKEVLTDCGIEVIRKRFYEIVYDVKIPEIIVIRNTAIGDRIQNIENLQPDSILKLFLPKSSRSNLELISDKGSIGELPSEISKKIKNLVISKKFNYKITIVDLVKLSKRNKYAKEPILSIKLEYSKIS